MNFIHKFLLRFGFYQSFIELLKKIKLPFFERVPLYTIISFFLKEIAKPDLSTRASAIAFNFFMALFPATIFLFSLLAYVPIENFPQLFMTMIERFVPASTYEVISLTILDIVGNQRSSLLSFGFLTAIYFSSNGVYTIMGAFNKGFEIFSSRNEWNKRLLSLGLTIALTFLLIFAIVVLVSGSYVINHVVGSYFENSNVSFVLLNLMRYLIVISLLFFALSILYHYGPSTLEKWRFISPGASLATILFIVSSQVFSFYIENFSTYNKLYGSIGTLIIIMLWIFINAFVLLIGFELNAAVYINKKIFQQELEEYMRKNPKNEFIVKDNF